MPEEGGSATAPGIAWVDQLTPYNEAKRALFRCCVPGCQNHWVRPVDRHTVVYHVATRHPGMELRWTKQRRLLTDEEQQERDREQKRLSRLKVR